MKAEIFSCLLLLGGTAVNALSLTTVKEKNLFSKSFHSHGQQVRPDRRDVSYQLSDAWNGVQVHGSRIASATAELIIPNITYPYGYNASSYYSSSVWVGIGGDERNCDNPSLSKTAAILQGGFYYFFDPVGDFGIYPFYEWVPNAPVFLQYIDTDVTDMGDHVRMSVTQKDNVTGTFTWENLTKNHTFKVDLKAPGNGTLCTNTAEWIAESFMKKEEVAIPYYFPDFGVLTFTNVMAITEAGEVAPLSDAIIKTAQPIANGYNLTSCNIPQQDIVQCKWLGYNNTKN